MPCEIHVVAMPLMCAVRILRKNKHERPAGHDLRLPIGLCKRGVLLHRVNKKRTSYPIDPCKKGFLLAENRKTEGATLPG